MASEEDTSLWVKKGATLSDKTAQKEFGLTQQEIIDAVREGKLQYRHTTLFGNSSLRLLRTELEVFVSEKDGSESLNMKKIKTELSKINSELRSLKRRITALEKRKLEILERLDS